MAKEKYTINARGSLGLLALGDVGLEKWRKIKQAELDKEKEKNEKK
ncbi:MAG TPA: hypothetical protein VKZ98_02890 [Aquaticitalea sp.]|nr:hypothetical protein [Aquaticitalea sp.]